MKKGSSALIDERIDLNAVLDDVRDPKAGGTVLFIGTVRDNSEAGRVDLIHYEAYGPMALKKLREIEADVERRWPTSKVKLVHRVGELGVGEVSVAVAVSAPHRAEAFEACRHAIEKIKSDVPIWKKERLSGGEEVWVEGNLVTKRRKVRRASK